MADLTKEQARNMAEQFEACVRAINTYRDKNNIDSDDLDRYVSILITKASQLRQMAASIVLNNLTTSLADITSATKGIEEAVKNIETIDNCIKYAGKVATLAAAIVSGNGILIATTTADVLSSLKHDGVIA